MIYSFFMVFWEIFLPAYYSVFRFFRGLGATRKLKAGKNSTLSIVRNATEKKGRSRMNSPNLWWGTGPLEKLTDYVSKTMPDYDAEVVTGKEAQAVSKFI